MSSTVKEMKRKASINYGLERLNLQIDNSKKTSESGIYTSDEMPGLEILEKFSSFNSQHFHFRWAIVLFFCNIYNFFTVGYYLGFPGFPKGLWFALELASEVIMVIDLLFRSLFRSSSTYKQMWFIHEKSTYFSGAFLILSSIPYSFICLSYSYNLNHWAIGLIRLPKLLRGVQFGTFFTNMRIIRRKQGWLLLEFFKILLVILVITHYASMIVLFIERVEKEKGHKNHYEEIWTPRNSTTEQIFMEIEFYGLGSLGGITISELAPYTEIQKLISVCYRAIGTSIIGAIFVKLVDIVQQRNIKKIETKQKLETAKTWVRFRKLSEDLKLRVLNYYNFAHEKFSDVIEYDFLDDLPLSLKTEISLYLHKDLIPKVKLFELGDPAFMMGIVRHLKPKLYMAEDYIIRREDYSEEFYFIRVGSVEVLASDDSTAICILEEGSYFGEIGILLKMCRTASVRATTATLISAISGENLLNILKNFPEHAEYLRKVAEQRLETTHVNEFNVNCDLLEEYSDIESINSEESEMECYAPAEHKNKSWLERFITVPESKAIPGVYKIDPFSYFFYIWSFMLSVSYIFYMYLIPFCIAFNTDGSTLVLTFDVIAYFIFVFDIYVSLNSSKITEFGNYIHDDNELRKIYYNKHLLLDLLVAIPSDFFAKIFNMPIVIIIMSKSVRLLKYRRVLEIYFLIKDKAEFSLSLARLLSYVPIVFYITHFEACAFYFVCRMQYEFNNSFNYSTPCYFSKYELDNKISYFSLPISNQYIAFYYFTASISSSNVYNLIFPVAISEIIYCSFLILISRLMLTFLLAEASTLVAIFQKPYTDHMTKVKIIKEWMTQYKFPETLKTRVSNYFNLSWLKLKGVEDEQIIKELPESMQIDISQFLYSGLIYSGFFPNDENGAIRSILKKCVVTMHCAGEEIISEGELGLEMYFVIEGEIEIVANKIVLSVLQEGQVFGEMALLTPLPTVRGATARARTDVSVAMLSMTDFSFVMKIYPEFAQKLIKQASQREENNRNVMHLSNVEALRKHKKLSIMVRNFEFMENDYFLNDNHENDFDRNISFVTIKRGKLKLLLRIHQSYATIFLYFFVVYLNIMCMPLNLAFRIDRSYVLGVEILSFILYFCYFLYYLALYMLLTNLSTESKTKFFPDLSENLILFKSIHQLILCLPLTHFLYDYSEIHGLWLFFLVIKLSNYHFVLEFWTIFKKKLVFFNLIRMIEVIFHFYSISHILACIYIEISRWDSPNWIDAYYIKFPLRQDKDNNLSIYLLATHWAFTALSNAALGDVLSFSNYEKLYNAFVCTLGYFVYAMLFGNVCSLVADFTPKLRSKLLESYNYVIDFIKKKRVDKVFKRQVNDYFRYLWHSNKGTIEREIIRQLPLNIMCDVQMFIYKDSISKSIIFKEPDGQVNIQLTRTLFRLMELQYYLIGDTIISIGDRKMDLYIILRGEVEVISLKGDRIIETLSNGDHFGEASILLNTSIRTASVISSKISQIGAIRKEKFEKLISAYSEWSDNLTKMASEKLSKMFDSSNYEDASIKLEKISIKFKTKPDVSKKYVKRAEKLVIPKLLETVNDNSTENQWFKLSLVHLLLLIYSIFAIPVHIAFNYPVTGYLMYVESLIILESVIFFLVTVKYSIISKGRKELDSKDLVSFFYQNFLFHDLIAISPFNLILPVAGITEPEFLIVFLRIIRLFAIIRIPSLLQTIEISSQSLLSNFILPVRSVFFLLILLHWSSCLWYFIVDHEERGYTWIVYNGITSDMSASQKWVQSIYYVLNIVTGIGYGDTFPVDNLENIITMMLLITGNILFAVAFGLIASLTSLLRSKVNMLLSYVVKILGTLQKSEIPDNLISRLEAYYVFNDSVVAIFGHLDCKSLYNHLPKNIVNKITYECNKHILRKMPFFRDSEFMEMTERISLHMMPKIYLPNDYIIYKNDVGEEMYFIILGSINVLSPENNKVIKTLVKGDYVGEVALLFDAKRLCSVIAKTLALLYMLSKKEFRDIIQDYPRAVEVMTEESNKRKKEASIFSENNIRNTVVHSLEKIEEEEKQPDIVKKLNYFSAISTPFFDGKPITEKNMTAISGMSNFNSELLRDSYFNEEKRAGIYKRRPNLKDLNGRRFSQESLGKEIVLSNFSKVKLQWIVEDNS